MPVRKNLEQLTIEAKAQVKTAWKGTSMKNDLFTKPGILKPKLLNPWEMAAALQSERANTKNFLSKSF